MTKIRPNALMRFKDSILLSTTDKMMKRISRQREKILKVAEKKTYLN